MAKRSTPARGPATRRGNCSFNRKEPRCFSARLICSGCAKGMAVSSQYKWYLVAILWWISFFNYADRQALSAVSKLLESPTVMGLSKGEIGLLGSAFAWTYGLCSPFAGYVVDRVRRKTAILSGLYVWSLICMATAACRGFGPLLVFRAAEGLGETLYYPASNSMISAYHGVATRSRALGIHQTSVYVGTIGGGFFAAAIGERYGWWWSFIVFGGLGILLGLVVNRFVIEPAALVDDLKGERGCVSAPSYRGANAIQ